MIVIPSIDIMDGKCVRLFRGDPSRVKVYHEDPLIPARTFIEQGAELLHIVDLDAALGLGNNLELVLRIVREIGADVQVGGGIRNFRRAEELLNNGVSRIIVGTSTVQNLSFVKEAVQRFGSARVSGAIDARDDEVVIEGWRFGTNVNYLDLAEVLEYSGVGSIIFTSVSRDGTMMGPALDNISKLVSRVKIPVIASGGIRDLGDLLEVARTGIEGVIVGTALYEGSFSLREAIEMVK